MISVIIPVYNVEKYLDRCIETVMHQSFINFEVILINDGSTDNSDLICKKWAEQDNRISYISKENQGLGITRNLGVKMAKYDYVTFLDSDDWWEKDYLELMLKPFNNPQVDIVCCDIHYWEQCETIKDGISELRMTPNELIRSSDELELINIARTFMWGKIFRKKLFTDNCIEQPAHAYEDIPITPFLVAKSRYVVRINKPLYYYYRNRLGSLANNVDKLSDISKSIIELVDRFRQEGLFNKYYNQLKKLVYSQVRFAALKSDRLLDEKKRKAFNNHLYTIATELFPELKRMWEIIYIPDSIVIRNALKKIVIDEKLLVVDNSIKYKERNNVNDGELWDIADVAFYELTGNI